MHRKCINFTAARSSARHSLGWIRQHLSKIAYRMRYCV